jgi:hypothetical protein
MRIDSVIPTIPTQSSTGRPLVRERDDDKEHDYNKGDRASINSIKLFPVDVDTH